MEFITSSFLGLIGGIIIGLLPGLGTTTFLLISFPFLVDKSLLFCITFYCVLSSVSQYFGSITTLSFGIPGENTSLPLFSIRDTILKNNAMSETYFLCAVGSFTASLLSGIIFYLTLDIYNNLIYIKSYVSLGCAVIGLIFCVLYSSNKIFISTLLLIAGWIFSKIGYDDIYNTEFLTFNNPYLYAGLPSLPVLLGIYAIPSLLIMAKESNRITYSLYKNQEFFNKKISILNNSTTILRSSIVGYICGLIPYAGNGISSFMAFLIEKKLKPNDYIAQATASESANNSANLSVLVPLLLLGIAIVPSEFVLLEILLSSNQYVSWNSLQNNYLYLVVCLIVTNLLAFYLSWKCVDIINKLLVIAKYYAPFCGLLLVILTVWFLGMDSNQGTYYFIVLIVFSVIGILLRSQDLMPFTYAFLLQNNIEQLVYRIYQIYF